MTDECGDPLPGPVDVTILDAVTGRTAVHRDGHFRPFQWAENGYACDCNRELFFWDALGQDGPERTEEEERHCLGARRYLVVALDPFPGGWYAPDEYNERYPAAAREAARAWRAARGAAAPPPG